MKHNFTCWSIPNYFMEITVLNHNIPFLHHSKGHGKICEKHDSDARQKSKVKYYVNETANGWTLYTDDKDQPFECTISELPYPVVPAPLKLKSEKIEAARHQGSHKWKAHLAWNPRRMKSPVLVSRSCWLPRRGCGLRHESRVVGAWHVRLVSMLRWRDWRCRRPSDEAPRTNSRRRWGRGVDARPPYRRPDHAPCHLKGANAKMNISFAS